MKKIFFYILAIVAMAAGLASCSNDVTSSVEKKNKDVVISVRLDRAEMSRVMGDPNATDEDSHSIDAKVSSLSFLVFDEIGTLITLHNDTYVEGKTYRFNTTTAANEMLILANIPSNIIHSINSKYDLVNNGILSLDADQYSAIPMVGNTSISITEQMDNENPFTQAISLKRLFARVGVSNITLDIPSEESFIPKEIFVYRVNEKHCIYDFSAENPWVGSSYSDFTELQDGDIIIKGATGETSISGSMPVLSSGYGDITLPQSGDRNTWQYFYVFPHDATHPTRMVLKGIYTDSNNNESVVYYPVIMNHVYNSISVGNTSYTDAANYADDSKLEANKSYLLDLTIKGKGAISPASDAPRGSTVDINFTVGNYSLASQVSEVQLEEDDRELSFNVTITIVSYKEAKQSTTI